MIEALIGGGVRRPDEKRLVPSRRPLPTRPRDLFELFSTLGQQATLPSVFLSCDLRQADARLMTYVALGRWPTAAELDCLPTPYVARDHLRTLLLSREFRANLTRRLCDAYPERPRLLYVRIPRCAGQHFLRMANTMHCTIPDSLTAWRRNDVAAFIPALGVYLARFPLTKTIQIAQPSLSPFTQTAMPPDQDQPNGTLPWSLIAPPRRPGDRLFTIIREPAGLILSQINATLADLQNPASPSDRPTAALRTRLGALPAAKDTAGWKAIGRKLLMTWPDRNPICLALGDGTAHTALQAARLADLEITDLSRYQAWVRYTWDVEPDPPTNAAPRILTKADLDPAAAACLTSLVDEDTVLYTPIADALAKLGDLQTLIRARNL